MKKNYLLILLSVLFFMQCSKENSIVTNIEKNSVQKDVISKNGRLIFKDSTALFKHVNWIIENQNNPTLIDIFNKEHGITSLNSVFQKGMDITDEKEFKAYMEKYPNAFVKEYYDSSELIDLPCPNVISYIANEYGIYQVGNVVTKVLKNTIITELYINENTLSELKAKNNISGLKLTISQQYYRTAYRDSKHRLVGRVKVYDYGNGWKIYNGTSTTQRKRLGVWLRSDLSGEVRVTWNYKMYYKDFNGNAHYEYKNGTKSDGKAHISTTVFSYYRFDNNKQVDISRSTCSVTHYGAGQSISISNVFTTH
jgi:hypothetical protein